MKTIEFYFDVGSPTTYLAWTQLPAIAERQGAAIEYVPFLLGAVHKATGNASPVSVAAKGRWMMADMARFAARYGVQMRHNPNFPINTLRLMRGATALVGTDDFHPYLNAVFEAMWVHRANMNDEAVVIETLAGAGLDPEPILESAGRQEVKDRLREATEEAVARGAFGAPTFFVGDEMFFGQDRLDFVEAELEAWRA